MLAALDPRHAYAFFRAEGTTAFLVLGAVFLVVTGGEALYADMGHFGRTPIRLAWFAVVLPALVLNYFGQGALVLSDPAEIAQPFYELAPGWALYPAGPAGDGRHGDRLAGGDRGGVLAHPAGGAGSAFFFFFFFFFFRR